jgi:predicted ATPase
MAQRLLAVCVRGVSANVRRHRQHLEAAMDRLAPEFAAYWLAEPERSGEPDGIDRGPEQALSPSQQVALEELADRVNAARSVV